LVANGNQNVIQNIKNIDPSFKVFDNINFGSDPNKMPDIQMRGQQSIPDIKGTYNGNPNQPLFILDGFESDISTIFDLDLNRIETVVLLKDAAAKAIYGARAANGVVVIETKKPEPGKMRFTYKGDLSITIPDLNGYNLCNAKEKYVVERDNASSQYEYFRERYLNYILGEITRGIDTYWLSIPLHVGIGHKHSVYLEGGDDRIRYGLDVMYNDISGVMKKSGRETFSGGFSLSYRYKNLLFRNQLSVVLNKAKDSPYGSFSEYTSLNPYWTPYNEDGSIKKILGTIGGGGLIETPISNPMWNAHINTKNFDKYTKLINNFYIEWNILDNLKLIGRLGLTKNQSTREDFYPANHTHFANYEDEKFLKGVHTINRWEITFCKGRFKPKLLFPQRKNQLYLNVGVNSQQNKSENETFSVIGFPNDKMDFIAFGKEYPLNSRPYGYESISREIGILSAMNYSYDNRFLADASYRASASSLFGKDSRWGHFWSVGFGWNIHNESCFKGLTWLKQFKVRASTGYTGSQNFNSYQALATFAYYQSQSYDNWIGSYLKGLPNNDLRWQKTQDYNLGVDLNFLGKISVRFDYYTQNTKDQLLDLTIPPSMGFTSYKENIGSTQNRGMELKVSSQVFSETNTNSYVNLFFSIARNKNKIKKISNALKSFNDANDKQLETGSHNDVTRPLVHYVEGQSLSSIWAVRSLGIDPASGKELFLTKDGRITSVWNVNDQVVCGDAMPKCSGSFGVNADYKGFFLNISMYYQLGSQMYNQTLVDRVENAYIPLNVDKRIYNAVWKQPNDIVSFSYDRFKTTKPTSRFVQDLNELTLSSLNFGYDFRNTRFIKSLGVSQLKASIYMENVFRASSVKTERGLSYPFARTYSFSIQTTF
jgi:TonB-linked outer membrane protein, SusC/RagA family/TonB-dependent outer membrane receptor, SusC/RagA subfamily, signature region